MTAQSISGLKNSTEALIQSVQQVPDESFNFQPSEDVWSPGQIVEHILITEGLIIQVLKGPSIKSDRAASEKNEKIRAGMEDMNKKMAAGAPIQPGSDKKDKNKLINKIRQSRMDISDLIRSIPIENEFTAFDHFIYGRLTGGEWITFIIYHSERHRKQIEERKTLNL